MLSFVRDGRDESATCRVALKEVEGEGGEPSSYISSNITTHQPSSDSLESDIREQLLDNLTSANSLFPERVLTWG